MDWHDYGLEDREYTVPDSQRRVLVAQDDGYIEMAYWNGLAFEHDWMPGPYGSAPTPTVPRVRYWCDLPDTPKEDGDDSPF
jgi:hypothetical protein